MDDNNTEELSGNRTKLVRTLLLILGGLALVGLGAGGIYGIVKQKPEWLGIKTQSQQAQEEVKKLLDEVGKLIELPPDETPTVATVSDASKVKDQPFFKNAKVGDKVIVYSNSKKAILYRPSENKIIEVGVVNLQQQTAVSGTPIPTNPVSVTPVPKPTFVYNPTKVPTITPTVTQ